MTDQKHLSLTEDECQSLIAELSELKQQLKKAEDQLQLMQKDHEPANKREASLEDTFDLSDVNDEIYRNASDYPTFKTDQFAFCEAVSRYLTEQEEITNYALIICEFSPTNVEHAYPSVACMDQETRNIEAIVNSATHSGTHVAYISHMERAIFMQTDTEGAAAATTAERLLRSLSQHNWPGRLGERSVKCSIGIALYPNDSSDIATLFRYADRALYNAGQLDDSYYAYYR